MYLCSLAESPHLFRRGFKSEIGKVCFLTVQESFVEAGKSQRRSGIHVDSAGKVKFAARKGGKKDEGCEEEKGKESHEGEGDTTKYDYHHWGYGGCQVNHIF